MITVTQHKIAGFDPRWAPFFGFSVLFDNPGDAWVQSESPLQLRCQPQVGGKLDLYARLEAVLDRLGRDTLMQTFLLCALPTDAYHVTVWDGVNTDNLNQLPADLQDRWRAYLQEIPGSLHRPPPATMELVQTSALLTTHFAPLTLGFDGLTIWDNQVLVARLKPVDPEAESHFKAVCRARNELSDSSRRVLGVSPSVLYAPHVSLGYFANADLGKQASAQLPVWSACFRQELSESCITFTSLGVYGFSDMSHFFRV